MQLIKSLSLSLSLSSVYQKILRNHLGATKIRTEILADFICNLCNYRRPSRAIIAYKGRACFDLPRLLVFPHKVKFRIDFICRQVDRMIELPQSNEDTNVSRHAFQPVRRPAGIISIFISCECLLYRSLSLSLHKATIPETRMRLEPPVPFSDLAFIIICRVQGDEDVCSDPGTIK